MTRFQAARLGPLVTAVLLSMGTLPGRSVAAGEEPTRWSNGAPSPVAGRSAAITAWTGTELLVVRGHGNGSDVGGDPDRADGAAYDPRTDTWRVLPRDPMAEVPSSPFDASPAGVWTGRELVIWGTNGPRAAAYDPRRNRWRSLPAGPLSARRSFGMVWDGRRVVIAGGSDPVVGYRTRRDAAAWDSVTGRWSRLPRLPFDAAPELFAVDGTVVAVGYGGGTIPVATWRAGQAHWHTIAPLEGAFQAAVVAPAGVVVATTRPDTTPDGYTVRAHMLVVRTGRWRKLPDIPLRSAHQLAAAGNRVVALAGTFARREGDAPPAGTAVLDLASAGRWETLPSFGDPDIAYRIGAATAWTGTDLVVYGGAISTGLVSTVTNTTLVLRPT